MAWDDEENWEPDAEDRDDDDSSEVLACPSCRGEVHEDTQQCPHCGDWITPIDPRDRSRRRVWTIVVIALIGSMFVFLTRL